MKKNYNYCLRDETHLNFYHQGFQVPKMEGFLNLIRVFWGWVFPYISRIRIHTAYIGVSDSSILGTFPTCLVRYNPNWVALREIYDLEAKL